VLNYSFCGVWLGLACIYVSEIKHSVYGLSRIKVSVGKTAGVHRTITTGVCGLTMSR
jgi:hypothetical protein